MVLHKVVPGKFDFLQLLRYFDASQCVCGPLQLIHKPLHACTPIRCVRWTFKPCWLAHMQLSLCHWQVSLITDIFAGLFEVFTLLHTQLCVLAHPHACKPTHIPAVQTWCSTDATSSTIFDTDTKLSRDSPHSSRLHITCCNRVRCVLFQLSELLITQQCA